MDLIRPKQNYCSICRIGKGHMFLQTKICVRCLQAKPATEQYFDLNLRNSDWLKSYCRTCSPDIEAERHKRKSEKSRQWAQVNREKVRESTRRTWQKTRSKRLEYLRRWRATNKEHIREYRRIYREQKRQL